MKYCDKTKFFNKALFYETGDYETMRKLLKKQNKDGN